LFTKGNLNEASEHHKLIILFTVSSLFFILTKYLNIILGIG